MRVFTCVWIYVHICMYGGPAGGGSVCACSHVNGYMCTQLYVWKPRLPWEASSVTTTYVGARSQSCSPWTCMASTLPTEPSPLALLFLTRSCYIAKAGFRVLLPRLPRWPNYRYTN